MIVFDRKEKEIKVPEGLGNINLTILDANLEDKTVEINEVETTILPSEGYDGIKAVEVNAQPIYDEGYNIGNAEGIEVGKTEQKALLEPITITENGTYENENGYSTIEVNVPDVNGSYDEGYTDGYAEGEAKGVENAGGIIAETARVLDITENGSYVSQYSGTIYPDITGVYPNGENFYSYAKLTNKKYITGLIPTTNTKLEIWYKPNTNQSGYVIGAQKPYTADSVFKIIINGNVIETELAGKRVDMAITSKWYHIEMSYADGLVIDGEKIGDYNRNISGTYTIPFGINFLNDVPNEPTQNNGIFGMIKITINGVENVIIPTADGFLNTNTGELLEVIQEGNYVFTEGFPIIPEGNLIKTVNVNVTPKINVAEARIKLQGSTFTKMPEWVDFEGVTNLGGMFQDCKNLAELPILNVPYCMDFGSMFAYIPFTDLTNIQYWVYPKNANWSLTFEQNPSLEKCSAIYMEGNIDYYQGSPFWEYSDLNNFTDFGGFIGLKYSINKDYIFPKMPNLTYESCINVLNGLYDFTGNGETPNSEQGQLKVHQNFLDTVGDEINIGVLKGWIITA